MFVEIKIVCSRLVMLLVIQRIKRNKRAMKLSSDTYGNEGRKTHGIKGRLSNKRRNQ